MALKEDFEHHGQWLFRWRSYLPVSFFVIFIPIIAFHNYQASPKVPFIYWDSFCVFISMIGLVIRIYTKGHAPRGTSGRNRKKQRARQLNTTGIYSIVRNPLYLGNYFMWLGIALLPQIFSLVLIFTLLFWLYYERVIFAEESFLREKFGSDYLSWAEETPAFIPSLQRFKKAELSFRLKYVIKREYHGFFALILSLVVVKLIRSYFYQHKLTLTPGWWLLAGVGFITWLSVRILRKHTTILKGKR